jgi:hypothetical protein
MALITINCPCSNKSTNVEITGGYNKMRTKNSNVIGELWETRSGRYKKYHTFFFCFGMQFSRLFPLSTTPINVWKIGHYMWFQASASM